MAAEKKELSFEKAIARLEEIVRELEDGRLPLENALELFEEGVGLSRICSFWDGGSPQHLRCRTRYHQFRSAWQQSKYQYRLGRFFRFRSSLSCCISSNLHEGHLLV